MTIVKNGPRSGCNRLGKEALLVGALFLFSFAPPASAAGFDLNALIEAAKAEEPITVYASTG